VILEEVGGFINRLLGAKGAITSVEFKIDRKYFRALVPDDQHWISIKDILLNREYEYLPQFELANLRGFTIIDIGAHVGLYSLVTSTYANYVVSVEPHPLNFKLLKTNYAINDVRGIAINAAVVGQPASSVKLCEFEHSAATSIVRRNGKQCYTVPATTLAEIIEKYAEEKTLLKIDIEGAEFNVLHHVEPDFLNRLKLIVMEVHLKYGHLNSIVKKLKKANFTVKIFYPPLVARQARPLIEVKNMTKLKLIRQVIYTVANLLKLKDKNLAILYAYKKY